MANGMMGEWIAEPYVATPMKFDAARLAADANLQQIPHSRATTQTVTMASAMSRTATRRRFLGDLSALGAAAFFGFPRTGHCEPPPETTKLKVFEAPATCVAPQYVAEELLRGEGFDDIQYVKPPSGTGLRPPENIIAGQVDICLTFPPRDIVQIDTGAPVVILAGSHSGCLEVVANNDVRSTAELKGKTVAVSELGSDEHVFIAMFAAYVGLNPQKDINWVTYPSADQPRLFKERKIDAFFAIPPASLELRDKKIGHVLVNMTTDKPWSQYHCCVVTSSQDFVRRNPVATKRALRAILKAGDICAAQPSRVARLISDKGLASYGNALKMLRELPYGRWRDYDPEDAVRFYALRMHDVGIIKSSPQKIIAQGTDWRFFNALKKELKA
jgi:NitT/TauT family transport system substrate-binding protein